MPEEPKVLPLPEASSEESLMLIAGLPTAFGSSKRHHSGGDASQKGKKKKSDLCEDPTLAKYFAQRYRFFSLFDRGIKLDHESWFSVTPERIAQHQARRCACNVAIDAFCGVGGNSIQLAQTCFYVIAIDIDPRKIEFARNNARIYGVEDRIEFICGDSMQLLRSLRGDVVFMSPPWGGPAYSSHPSLSLDQVGDSRVDIPRAILLALEITPHVAVCLPKNLDLKSFREKIGCCSDYEFEENLLNNQVKMLTCYFGDLKEGESEADG